MADSQLEGMARRLAGFFLASDLELMTCAHLQTAEHSNNESKPGRARHGEHLGAEALQTTDRELSRSSALFCSHNFTHSYTAPRPLMSLRMAFPAVGCTK